MTADNSDLKLVERLSEQLANALNSGDISSVDDLAASDAVLSAPGRNLVQGNSDVVAAWRIMSLRFSGVRFFPTVMQPLGAEAMLEVGMFSARPKRAGEERATFKYQFVWHKRASDWKLVSMAWNRPASEKPRADAGAPAQGMAQGSM